MMHEAAIENRTAAGETSDGGASIRPRRTSHWGSVLAAGIAIDARLTGENEARRRTLALLARGDAVYRFGAVLAIRFASPVRMDAASAAGAPLVLHGRLLSSCPLEADECEALGPDADALVLAQAGRAVALPLNATAIEDVPAWIDVSAFEVADGLTPLGAFAAAPAVQFTELTGDMRAALGVTQPDHLAEKLFGPFGPGIWGPGGFIARMARLIRRLKSLGSPDAGKPARAPSGTSSAAASSEPAFRQSRAEALRERIMRALWSSKLGALLGYEYAKRLSQLIAMFDSNDLDNALHHALPIGAAGALPARSPSLWFSLPWVSLPWASWRRKNLTITPDAGGRTSSIGLDARLLDMLRERYRRAAERLEARGQIEKAAFVHAELLNAAEEAVSLLEKHGLLRKAAEVAELRRLEPAILIRQWFLAGNVERAILIAQRSHAYAQAILRLEKTHKEQADAFRLLWGDRLAKSGAYAAAVEVAWPVKSARRLACAWIDHAIAAGGAAGARMLAWKAVSQPAEFPQVLDKAREFFDDEGEEGTRTTTALGEELLAGELTDEARILAAAAIRRLLPDAAAKETSALIEKLFDVVGDAALRADARPSSLKRRHSPYTQATPLRTRSTPVQIIRTTPDQGAIPVLDAAETADGRMLAAIGEAGALLLSRTGKVITHFAEPAHHIVMSDNGDRAILLAPRGEAFRLCRVDLVERRLQPWKDARFDVFAPSFDGMTWFVARESALYGVDATASDWRSVWKVEEDGAHITHVCRDSLNVSFRFWKDSLTIKGAAPEVWVYDVHQMLLRRRISQPDAGGASVSTLGLSPMGELAGWRDADGAGTNGAPRGQASGLWSFSQTWADLPLTTARTAGPPALSREWLALSKMAEYESLIHLMHLPYGAATGRDQVRAAVRLEMAARPQVRFQDGRMVVFDDCGRILVISLETGAVLREHRVS